MAEKKSLEEKLNKLVEDGNKGMDKAIKKYTQALSKIKNNSPYDYKVSTNLASALEGLNMIMITMSDVRWDIPE